VSDLKSHSPIAKLWHSLHDPMFSHFDKTLTCGR